MATNKERVRFPDQLSKPLNFYFATKDVARRRLGNKWRANPAMLFATPKDLHTRSPNAVYSTDLNYINFKSQLVDILNETYPATIDENGFARNYPVTRDFSQLYSTTGVGMKQLNIPLADNSTLLKDLGLNNTGFESDVDKTIFNVLFDLMFGTYKPASYQVAKQSSSTFPFFVTGEQSYDMKMKIVDTLLDDIDTLVELVEADDWDALRDKYYIVMAYNLSVRHQPDGKGKDRKVRDIEGREIVSDKTSYFERQNIHDAVAMRVRTVYGLCAALNYLMSFFMVCRREHYFDEYAFTWHHTGPEALYDGLVEAKDVVGLDVTQMDQTVPKWFLDAYADRLNDVFHPGIAKLFKTVNGAPYYASAISPDQPNFFMGDPGDPSTWDISVGLASGRADNPDLGKFWMTFVYVSMLHKIRPIVKMDPINDLDNFLKGNHDVWILKDMGDDAIVGVKHGNEAATMELQTLLSSGEASTYAKLDIEEGVAFLGMVLVKNSIGELEIPKPNLVSFVVNRLVPERGITDHFRQYWGQGLLSAIDHYRAMGSITDDVIKIIKDVWKLNIDYPDPFVCAKMHAESQRAPLAATLNPADLEVMMDNSKMRYKYKASELSEEVLALYSWTIDAERIDKAIAHLNTSIDLTKQTYRGYY